MIVSIVSMWTFRIGFSYIIGLFLGLGAFGVWVAMVIDWVARSICFVYKLTGKRWLHHRYKQETISHSA
jgi:Na+-driven multidrug efflux pump